MDGKWTIFLMVVAPIAGLLTLATAVKYVQVRRARSWLQVRGKIISAKSVSRPVRRIGSDIQEKGQDTELRNFADVAYDFEVQGKKRRGTRISIGEDLGNGDVAGQLKLYRPGTAVTVFYNPNDPNEAVLERDMPEGAFQFMGWLIAGWVACGLLAITGVEWIGRIVQGQLPNPKNAPFAVGFSLFALFTGLFARAAQKQASATAGWQQTRGRIVTSATEAFRTRPDISASSSVATGFRTQYRQRIQYSYQVAGIGYAGDRVAFGGRTSGTLASLESSMVKRYPAGSDVTVFYDPANPSQAVLERDAKHVWILWVCVAAFMAAALYFATTSGGKA